MFNTGLLETVKIVLKTEGAPGFFRGIGAPLISIPLINSIVFSSYELSKRFMLVVKDTSSLELYECRLPSADALCGAFAGVVNSLVVCPVELIKIKLQTQKQKRKYKTSLDAIVKLTIKGGPLGIVDGLHADSRH